MEKNKKAFGFMWLLCCVLLMLSAVSGYEIVSFRRAEGAWQQGKDTFLSQVHSWWENEPGPVYDQMEVREEPCMILELSAESCTAVDPEFGLTCGDKMISLRYEGSVSEIEYEYGANSVKYKTESGFLVTAALVSKDETEARETAPVFLSDHELTVCVMAREYEGMVLCAAVSAEKDMADEDAMRQLICEVLDSAGEVSRAEERKLAVNGISVYGESFVLSDDLLVFQTKDGETVIKGTKYTAAALGFTEREELTDELCALTATYAAADGWKMYLVESENGNLEIVAQSGEVLHGLFAPAD